MLVQHTNEDNTDFIGNLINCWIVSFITYAIFIGHVYIAPLYVWIPGIGQIMAMINFDAWAAIFGSPGLTASIVLPLDMWPAKANSQQLFFNDAAKGTGEEVYISGDLIADVEEEE